MMVVNGITLDERMLLDFTNRFCEVLAKSFSFNSHLTDNLWIEGGDFHGTYFYQLEWSTRVQMMELAQQRLRTQNVGELYERMAQLERLFNAHVAAQNTSEWHQNERSKTDRSVWKLPPLGIEAPPTMHAWSPPERDIVVQSDSYPNLQLPTSWKEPPDYRKGGNW